MQERVAQSQGSTHWLSWLSEITETPISHEDFSQEITYKMPKKRDFWQNMFQSQKHFNVKEIVLWQKQNYVKENKFMSQKHVLSAKKAVREKITFRKHVSITKTSFSHRNKFLPEFLSEKHINVTEKVSVTEKNFS